jgi:hypothetical protein
VRALRDGNPAYHAVSVMRVDWDTYRDAEITRRLAVRRRSTLVMFAGGKEVGRVVAETGRAPIEALFTAALAAAQ